MKHWYQYRCEEVTEGSDLRAYNLMQGFFTSENGISRRLKCYLFAKLCMGGIEWQYKAGWTDHRGIHGNFKT